MTIDATTILSIYSAVLTLLIGVIGFFLTRTFKELDNKVEFRIFRGTLKYNTLAATLQLVNKICDISINMTDEELTALNWCDFVSSITEPELITYLKERMLYVNEPIECEEDV